MTAHSVPARAFAAVVGAVFVSALATAAPAAAQPDLEPILDTQCSYPQVVAALEANDPQAASQLAGAPAAQGILQQFLQSPRETRAQLAAQVQGLPGAQQYFSVIGKVAQDCRDF